MSFFGKRPDPTTIRAEARDIEIGAPDGRGYALALRECADRIEELEQLLEAEEVAHDAADAQFEAFMRK